MDKQKKGFNIIMKLMIILFVMFLCLYSVSKNGYYRNSNQTKTLYTEEMIKRFEEDVSNGKYVDIDEYLKSEEKDYSNKVSKFGEWLSNIVSVGANKCLDYLFSLFSYLFN